MDCTETYINDINIILEHQYGNDFESWTTPDKKLLKRAPFNTLESPLYLLDLQIIL